MELTKDHLMQLDFFAELEPRTLKNICKVGQIQQMCGGNILYEQGKPADALYFVITGRLVVARTGPEGETIVGYISTGEPAGEMSLLLDEPHSATVYALRDTEVLKIEHPAFDRLLEQHGDLAARLSRLMLQRTRAVTTNHERFSPRVFGLVGSSPSIDLDQYGRQLVKSISAMGLRANYHPHQEAAMEAETFARHEADHDIIILGARVSDTDWYRFVLRHADRFFVFARRDAIPPNPFPLSTDENASARRFRLVDLVMLAEGNPACPVATWRDAIGAQRIFILDDNASIARLARVIAGRSVGVVLSGGGARAYAHIGAIRALREAGVPIDFTSGTSMGAIIAACIGLGWDDAEVDFRIRQAFVDSNPLSDFRLPVVALTRGTIVEERLHAHFGETLIEEMDLPFFCLSAELTEGVSFVHRSGKLRDALRASISLPGILPPVVIGDKLLVDGGLINNFPTDIMAQTHRGINIGIDVARKGSIDALDYVDAPGFFNWVRQHGIKAPPPIVGLLMRAATTRRESTMLHHPADILITPAVQGVDLRSWKSYDLAVHEGYVATIEALESNPNSLALITAAQQ